MDKATIEDYNQNAQDHAIRHKSQVPLRLYSIVETFFHKEASTLDLGCGIGRDTNWLNSQGYNVIGVDASEGMLSIAKSEYPAITFNLEALPKLSFENAQFDNIFCSAVLMHIQRSDLTKTISEILRITKTNGKIIISYRHGNNETGHRLFENYYPGQVASLFESFGGKVLLIEEDHFWFNLVIEKKDITKREGLETIQDIISRDKKTSTYKFALLRALCEISRYEEHSVTWYHEGDQVLVPLKRIAIRWLYYYHPLIDKEIRQTTNTRLAFENDVREISRDFTNTAFLQNEIEKDSKDIKAVLKKISDTVKKNPARYAGRGEYNIFKVISPLDSSVYSELKDSEHGMLVVPIELWRDISHFSHWIEDSLVIQWAQMTENLNKTQKFPYYLDLITKSIQESERSTIIIRRLLRNKNVHCVWSGKVLSEFDVDHMLPWSVWKNNDIWNLLPSDPKINNSKRDLLPSLDIIKKRFDNENGSIKGYWELYAAEYPDLIDHQLRNALGISIQDALTSQGREALEFALIKTQLRFGIEIWKRS